MTAKRILCILLSVSLCAGLTACSSKDLSDTADAASAKIDQAGDIASNIWEKATDSLQDLTETAKEKGSEYFRSTTEASAEARDVLSSYYDYCKEKGSDAVDLKGYIDNIGTGAKGSMDDLYALINDQNNIVIPEDHMDEAIDYLKGKSDTLTDVDDGDSYTEVYMQTMESLRKRSEDPEAFQEISPTFGELLATAQLSKDGSFSPEDFGISVSSVVSPKYVLKQAVGTFLGKDSMDMVLTVGPQIYDILKDTINDEGIDENTLDKMGLAAVISASDGSVEGDVGKVLESMMEDTGGDADPSVTSTLTFLAIEGAIHGYDLSKGIITPEEYGDIMAESLMTSLLALPSNSVLLAVLPSAQMAMVAGCMAGGMLVCLGFDKDSTEEAAMNMINGGGFEAIVPEQKASNALKLTKDIFKVSQ